MDQKRLPVLVTGGAGYIGSHTVLALRDAGWPVAVIDDLSTGFRWAVPDDVPFYEGDVGNQALVWTIVAEQGIRAVMHFAGSVIVPESVANPLKYYGNNTAKSRALIEAAVVANVPHFIFSSTAAVYGVPSDEPVTEDYPRAPANPYGMSKLMTELMLADVAAAYPINYCALRYFNVAAADPRGRAGQSTLGATSLIKIATEVAAGKRPALEIHLLVGIGDQISEVFFQLHPANLFQDGHDPIGHLRLLNLGFLQKRHRGVAIVDELPADRLDDAFILVAEEPNQCTDLAFVHKHDATPVPSA